MSPAARTVSVEAGRLEGWLQGFSASHGTVSWQASAGSVVVTGADGTVADCAVPFPPLVATQEEYGGLLAHIRTRRRLGVLLVRKGGYAVGVYDGPDLVASKVGSRHVQGRAAAGGWSQQRFARRREAQAKEAYAAAARWAATVLLPEAAALDAVVLGGDREALKAVLADPRLAPLTPLVVPDRLEVPEPNRKLLLELPKRLSAVRISLTDP
jgi:hypothetical protein